MLSLVAVISLKPVYACADPSATNYDPAGEETYDDCTYGNPTTVPATTAGGNPTTVPAGGSAGNPTTVPAGAAAGNPTTIPAAGTPGNPTTIPARTGGNTFYLQNPLDPKFNSVGGLVQGALEIFSYLVIIFAVLMLIWVGLQFILAQGNPDKLKELKNWLLWIVVGVAIVIGARIIVSIVINTLQATGTVSPSVIQSAHNGLNGVSPTP